MHTYKQYYHLCLTPYSLQYELLMVQQHLHMEYISQGGGAPPHPLLLEKILFFWRKIVISHTKYPQHFRASLRSAQFF